MSGIEDIREERLKKKQLLIDAGMDAYPVETHQTHTINQTLTDFDTLTEQKTAVTIAGRVMTIRQHGGSLFSDVYDGTGRVQIFLSRTDIGEQSFDLFVNAIDMGDFVEATGVPFVTKRGTQAISLSSWRVLTKSLRNLPSEWFGIKDEDERYRQRYLDILLNEKTREIVYRRAKFWKTVRSFLDERDFVEVETPVLENTTGGADARPFVTHHNALDIDVYLRISAGELWQKKLMVAGIPKTYEIGRIFRNEGMSAEHLQDYTQLEFYEAYSDYRKGMRMITELYKSIANEVFGTTSFTIRDMAVDLSSDWQTIDYNTAINDAYGIDPRTVEVSELCVVLEKEDIQFDKNDISKERGVDMLWKKLRKNIAGPAFLVHVPVYLEPLAKRSPEDNRVVERFQVLIAGSEVGKGFSELNDPNDQRERFIQQQALRDAGDDEAQMADMEYVEALEYGMPPSFGFGMSERFFAFLSDMPAREAQIFPLMRPRL